MTDQLDYLFKENDSSNNSSQGMSSDESNSNVTKNKINVDMVDESAKEKDSAQTQNHH